MGIGFRILLFTDDGALERISFSRYNRLHRNDPEESFPHYAGKRLRYALVVLDLVRRKPVGILHIQYAFLQFDSKGRLDIKEREREARMAVELFPSLHGKEHPSQLIDARHRFARKRYANDYHWKPSREIETALAEAIFGKDWR